MNTQLKSAEPMDGTKLRLVYADGFRKIVDLAPALRGPIFARVKSPDFFAKLRVESDTIRWPNGADIDPSVLRLWAERGKVSSQEQTDAHYAQSQRVA